jgi:hypothetical protein
VADFTRDGRPDLAAVAITDNVITLLCADDKGGFARTLDYPVGGQPTFAAAADLDGDGHPDLVVTNGQSNDLSILLAGP